MTTKSLGKRLKDYRESKMMTQAEFAKRLTIRQSYLSQLETDAKAMGPKIRKLLKTIFGADVYEWERDLHVTDSSLLLQNRKVFVDKQEVPILKKNQISKVKEGEKIFGWISEEDGGQLFSKGDLLIIDPAQGPGVGDLGLISFLENNGIKVRKILCSSKKMVLRTLDPGANTPDLTLNRFERKKIVIVGKVIEMRRKL
jgi:transcriptional regulator with XRE-family HTH domain